MRFDNCEATLNDHKVSEERSSDLGINAKRKEHRGLKVALSP